MRPFLSFTIVIIILVIVIILYCNNYERFDVSEKKKVAVILTGAMGYKNSRIDDSSDKKKEYIDYTSVYKSLNKFLISPNKDYFNFDFYIHMWNPDLEEEMNDLYNPVKSMYERNDKYHNIFVKSLPNSSYNDGGSIALHSKSLSKKKGIELMLSTGEDYDYVIIYRPDVLLWANIVLSDYDNTKIYHNGPLSSQGDFHYIMNMENVRKFKNLFDSAYDGNIPEVHVWVDNYIRKYMKMEVYADSIIAGHDQEVMRVLKSNSIDTGRISDQILEELDIK